MQLLNTYYFSTYDNALATYLQLDKYMHNDVLLKYNIVITFNYNLKGDYYIMFIKCKVYSDVFAFYLINRIGRLMHEKIKNAIKI